MSKSFIPASLRRQVEADSRSRCGYCLTSAQVIGQPMVIEHIIPESKGGKTVRENLWLSCRRCNEFKGSRIHAVDPLNEQKQNYLILVDNHGQFTSRGPEKERR